MHVRLLHLDVVDAHHRVELDLVHLGALAHHLLVHLAVGRHVDDRIAQQLRLAAEAPVAQRFAARLVVALDVVR